MQQSKSDKTSVSGPAPRAKDEAPAAGGPLGAAAAFNSYLAGLVPGRGQQGRTVAAPEAGQKAPAVGQAGPEAQKAPVEDPQDKADWAISHSQAVAYTTGVYDKVREVLADVALDYKAAYESHKAVLEDVAARKNLETAVVFGVLGAALGGIGGAVVGQWVKASVSSSMYVIEGAKAITKHLISDGLKPQTIAFPSVGMDPFAFHVGIQKRVDAESSQTLLQLSQMSYNPAVRPLELVQASLKSDGVDPMTLGKPDGLETLIETKMWKAWIQQYGVQHVQSYGMEQWSYSPPKEVSERLKVLGISEQEAIGWVPELKGARTRTEIRPTTPGQPNTMPWQQSQRTGVSV